MKKFYSLILLTFMLFLVGCGKSTNDDLNKIVSKEKTSYSKDEIKNIKSILEEGVIPKKFNQTKAKEIYSTNLNSTIDNLESFIVYCKHSEGLPKALYDNYYNDSDDILNFDYTWNTTDGTGKFMDPETFDTGETITKKEYKKIFEILASESTQEDTYMTQSVNDLVPYFLSVTEKKELKNPLLDLSKLVKEYPIKQYKALLFIKNKDKYIEFIQVNNKIIQVVINEQFFVEKAI